MAQLLCLVTVGDAPVTISWVFHGPDSSKASQNGVSVVKMSSRSSSLIIESLTSEHSGNYTCTARNAAGVANHTAEIEVNGTYSNCLERKSECSFISQSRFYPYSTSSLTFIEKSLDAAIVSS